MKNDEYQWMKQFDSIRAPSSAVDKAVKAAHEAEKNRKAYDVKPKRSLSKFVKVTVAAACAVIAVGAGTGIFFNSTNTNTNPPVDTQISENKQEKNSFFLTVNAAELTEGEAVNFVDFDTSEPGKLFNTGCSGIKPDEILNSDGSDTDLIFYPTLVFPIGCYGENIKSVKYEINNAFYNLFTDKKPDENGLYGGLEYTHPGLIEKGEKISSYEMGLFLHNGNLPKNALEAYSETDDPYLCHFRDKNAYRSFTVNYDQTELSVEEINDLLLDTDQETLCLKEIRIGTKTNRALLNSEDPKIREAANYLTHMRGAPQEEEFLNEKDDLRKAILEGIIKDITIDITVTFKDGETEKRTIALEPGELVTPEKDHYGKIENFAIGIKARLLPAEAGTEQPSDTEQIPESSAEPSTNESSSEQNYIEQFRKKDEELQISKAEDVNNSIS